MIQNPNMKEIIIEFCDESETLLDDLELTLEALEEDPRLVEYLETFGQKIDRIMGAAKSIGAEEIATLSELGKTIGYKSSQVRDIPLIEVVVAILFDSLDIMRTLIDSLRKDLKKNVSQLNTKAFVTRLKWLSEKFKDIERASVAIDTATNPNSLNQNSIDDLLRSLGLNAQT